jgi:hypothetical protein
MVVLETVSGVLRRLSLRAGQIHQGLATVSLCGSGPTEPARRALTSRYFLSDCVLHYIIKLVQIATTLQEANPLSTGKITIEACA